jgi:histidyl-tRNA synthetase
MSEHKMQPVRGTKDLFGAEILQFNLIVDIARDLALRYNFKELQTPIFEFSEVFERNLGETSDIISKEVYKFKDRGDNFLTLRPEFTAAVVRALISNGEFAQILPQKFFSFGPIFRYDRPQKGRQRQFHQINYEVFGEANPLQDVEIIVLAADLLESFGVLNKVELHINSLGCALTKQKYEEALRLYFSGFEADLSEDSKARLQKNPLRILDSKAPCDIKLFANAPKISDFYSSEAKQRFASVLNDLEACGIHYVVNEKLVRGLDYYSSMVFEFVMIDKEGAQNTVLAGGRYDGLVAKMGGKETAAIGFAAGIERLMLLSEIELEVEPKVMAVYIDKNQEKEAFLLAKELRDYGFETDFLFDASFKKQMKKASQNQVKFVLIIGEDELKNNEVVIKNFDDSTEKKVKRDQIFEILNID